jgi:DNA polymerase-1
MNPLLLIDANNLASQCYYAMGKSMTHGDIATGVVYGFLRDIATLLTLHNTKQIAFCFDHGKPKRARLYPAYKANRKPESIEDKEHRSERNRQINLLRNEYLPAIGFKNVFWQEGYEADDLIASIVRSNARLTDIAILSSDKDLYQLLSPRVFMWNRGKKTTLQSFYQEWGIKPDRWAEVKAMAGCTSDNIEGIDGVGEKTAIKFLKGELKAGSKAWKEINARQGLILKNLQLTTLPFPNTLEPVIQKDSVTRETWNTFVSSLNMKTLQGLYPSDTIPSLASRGLK